MTLTTALVLVANCLTAQGFFSGTEMALEGSNRADLKPHASIFSVSFAVAWCPGKYALLVRAAGPTKGTALRQLCERQSITTADAGGVGDWVNDIPMFEVAGRSFVMGGAPDAVASKASDTLVRQTGEGGGIAEAIRRAWG